MDEARRPDPDIHKCPEVSDILYTACQYRPHRQFLHAAEAFLKQWFGKFCVKNINKKL